MNTQKVECKIPCSFTFWALLLHPQLGPRMQVQELCVLHVFCGPWKCELRLYAGGPGVFLCASCAEMHPHVPCSHPHVFRHTPTCTLASPLKSPQKLDSALAANIVFGLNLGHQASLDTPAKLSSKFKPGLNLSWLKMGLKTLSRAQRV